MAQKLLPTCRIQCTLQFRTLHVLVPLTGLLAVIQVVVLLRATGKKRIRVTLAKLLLPIKPLVPLACTNYMVASIRRAPFRKDRSTLTVLVLLDGPLHISLFSVITALELSIRSLGRTPVIVLVPSCVNVSIWLVGVSFLGVYLSLVGSIAKGTLVNAKTLCCCGEVDVNITGPT